MTKPSISQEKLEERKKVDSLLVFIKSLKTKQAFKAFALQCGTTEGNLQQIAYGGSVSAVLSKQINQASNGKVLLRELRPDIFA